MPTRDLPSSPTAESVRRLLTNLQYLDVDDPPRVLAVASSVPAEGKTTVACDLAVALAAGGDDVLLIEADLRRPGVADRLGLERSVGLTTVLAGRVDLADAVQHTVHGAAVLTSGPLVPTPGELLASHRMQVVLAEARARYHHVVLDTAPLLTVSDAAAVVPLVDGVLLLCRWGSTSGTRLAQSVGILQAVSARALGVVLTLAPAREAPADRGGYCDLPAEVPDLPTAAPGLHASPVRDGPPGCGGLPAWARPFTIGSRRMVVDTQTRPFAPAPAPAGELPGRGVLVHEWLARTGGSERVFDHIVADFPGADVLSLWDDSSGSGRYPGRTTRETWLARTPLRHHKELALPLMPLAWAHQMRGAYDWAVVSSHSFAHHVRFSCSPGMRKVLYVHTPARYVWEPDLDARGGGHAARAAGPLLRAVDRRKAAEAHTLIANSHYVARRIERTWSRTAQVIHPPVEVAAIAAVGDWRAHLDGPETARVRDLPATYVLVVRFVRTSASTS